MDLIPLRSAAPALGPWCTRSSTRSSQMETSSHASRRVFRAEGEWFRTLSGAHASSFPRAAQPGGLSDLSSAGSSKLIWWSCSVRWEGCPVAEVGRRGEQVVPHHEWRKEREVAGRSSSACRLRRDGLATSVAVCSNTFAASTPNLWRADRVAGLRVRRVATYAASSGSRRMRQFSGDTEDSIPSMCHSRLPLGS